MRSLFAQFTSKPFVQKALCNRKLFSNFLISKQTPLVPGQIFSHAPKPLSTLASKLQSKQKVLFSNSSFLQPLEIRRNIMVSTRSPLSRRSSRFAGMPFKERVKKDRLLQISIFITVGGTLYLLMHIDTVEISGRKRLILMSPDEEKALGEMSYQQILNQFGGRIHPQDSELTQMVKRVSERIIEASGSKRLQSMNWKFHVIEAPGVVNAFVLPGGKVFVFTGILPIMKNEDGMAAVLGHEIGHTFARHIAEENTFSSIMFSFALFFSILFGLDPNVVAVPGNLLKLSHSRKCELEADHIGLLLMAKACYNPDQVVGFWQRMQQYGKKYKQPPAFISTHPPHRERIEYLQSHMPEAQKELENHQCFLQKRPSREFTVRVPEKPTKTAPSEGIVIRIPVK